MSFGGPRVRASESGSGRGSAAGCLISYLIGIVAIDPISWGLLFERFLNP
jgi:DNA polymerase-3 subunit alpha